MIDGVGVGKSGSNDGQRRLLYRRRQENKCSTKQGVERAVVSGRLCEAAHMRSDFSEADALDLLVKGEA